MESGTKMPVHINAKHKVRETNTAAPIVLECRIRNAGLI